MQQEFCWIQDIHNPSNSYKVPMELLYAQGYGKQQAKQDLNQLWIPKAPYQKLPTNSQYNCPRTKPQIQKKQMWVPKQLLQTQGK